MGKLGGLARYIWILVLIILFYFSYKQMVANDNNLEDLHNETYGKLKVYESTNDKVNHQEQMYEELIDKILPAVDTVAFSPNIPTKDPELTRDVFINLAHYDKELLVPFLKAYDGVISFVLPNPVSKNMNSKEDYIFYSINNFSDSFTMTEINTNNEETYSGYIMTTVYFTLDIETREIVNITSVSSRMMFDSFEMARKSETISIPTEYSIVTVLPAKEVDIQMNQIISGENFLSDYTWNSPKEFKDYEMEIKINLVLVGGC